MSPPATVYFVGAGPGDPEAITLRGVACLRMADVVLYDYLVSSALLEYVSASAECACLGHHRTGRTLPKEEVNRRMIEAARAGRAVVRLKSGDPSVFGRLAEETAAVRAAGVPLEIVPGVTAGLAATAVLGPEFPQQNRMNAVSLITGHERPGKTGLSLDYAAIAGQPGRLIFYMGVTTADEWSEALMRHGRPRQTPVAVVRQVTWPDEQVWSTTLGDVAELIGRERIRPPAVIVVGGA